MKKFEIYKNDVLIISVLTSTYGINTYTNTIEIAGNIDDIEITYTIPLNEGYKIIVDL